MRRVSASAIDGIAYVFDMAMLDVLLPLVRAKLSSQDWLDRESSILALGAVALGCSRGSRRNFWTSSCFADLYLLQAMESHLPYLLPFLANQLKDPQFLIRSITCWTLSRYAEWFTSFSDPQTYFEPILKSILPHILDKHKKVQEAACSALAIITKTADVETTPYLALIVPVYMQAFASYQLKASFVLCDTLGTLAKAVGSDFTVRTFHPFFFFFEHRSAIR